MRPIIGLIPLYDDEKDSLWMLPGYMKALEAAGGVPIMLPATEDEEELKEAYALCDGILFTGGHDVDPAIYGAVRQATCGSACKVRDVMEALLLEECLKDNKPFLGICRGIQFINAYLGGTLYQDLPSEYTSQVEHHMTPPYDVCIHTVTVREKSQLADIIGAGIHGVNSYHHQAIRELSPQVEAMAVSEDGLVEAIAVKNHRFAIGVQWHPEFSYERQKESLLLVQAFVRECGKSERRL